MIAPKRPANEIERQAALERYAILDSLPEAAYDDITALMAHVCGVPIALVGLLDRDRNWLKSRHGIPLEESPRELSFCGHAIVSDQAIFTVEDARLDPRFADNPLVTEHGAVGYAGVPLVDPDGFALGTLCVFNPEPLVLDASQTEALRAMARQVMYLLERHLRERTLEAAGAELAERNAELKCFAGAVSHDLRSPLTNVVELAGLLQDDLGDGLGDESRACLAHIRDVSASLRGYVDRLLAHYTSEELLEGAPEPVRLAELFDTIRHLAPPEGRATLTLPDIDITVRAHAAALQQVLVNLVGNALKHGGDAPRVGVRFERTATHHRFDVIDDGPGIAPERHESIFALFDTSGPAGAHGAGGTGIGLATVRRIVGRLGGTIELDSALGRGTTFTVRVPRHEPARAELVRAA